MSNFFKKAVISTASAGMLVLAGLSHAQTMAPPPAQGPSDTPPASQQGGSAEGPAAGTRHGDRQASPSGAPDRSGQAGGADRTHPHADGPQEAGKLHKSKDGAGSTGETRNGPATTDRNRSATGGNTMDRNRNETKPGVTDRKSEEAGRPAR